MAEPNQPTGPQNPGGTGGEPGGNPPAPTATPPQNGGGTATQDDDNVTLSKEDYNNLIGQRDRSNNTIEQQGNFIETIAQERAINQFLSDNKDKYPDLTLDDLRYAESPEDLEKEAARVQRRLEDHAQAKLLEIESHQPPQETPDQRAARLADLRKNPGPASHLAYLEDKLS